MPARRKLLVIGLDAASPVLLRRWTADGSLPALRELMGRGIVGDSRSVPGLFVGATWPSFYTGQHPGRHGVYWLDRLLPGTYRTQRVRARDLGRCPAVWDVLSAAGRSVAVLDVPLTRLSPGIAGTQVVEWGVHDAAFGFRTAPRALGRALRRNPGPHPAPARCDAPARTLEDAVAIMGDSQLKRKLTPDEVRQLVAFLNSLTGEFPSVPYPQLPRAFPAAAPATEP